MSQTHVSSVTRHNGEIVRKKPRKMKRTSYTAAFKMAPTALERKLDRLFGKTGK